MKKLIFLLVLLTTASHGADYHSPYDPGAARKSDLGTISTKADTDYVATSALALRLDTTNASFTGDIDVTGDVGAATLNGMTPGTMVAVNSPVPVANGGTGKTTAAEGLEALGGASLNGSSTVAFNASTINGVAPLTAAEKTQALVGSTTVDFLAAKIKTGTPPASVSSNIGKVGFYSFENSGTIATYTLCTMSLLYNGEIAAVLIEALNVDAVGGANTQTIKFVVRNIAGTLTVSGASSASTDIVAGGYTLTYEARIDGTTLYVDIGGGVNYFGSTIKTTVAPAGAGRSVITWP